MSVCCEGGSLQFLPVLLLPVEHGLAKNTSQCWRSSLREMHLKHLHSRCLWRRLSPGQQGWQRRWNRSPAKVRPAVPSPSCVHGHRPSWNCCSFMELLLSPEIAPGVTVSGAPLGWAGCQKYWWDNKACVQQWNKRLIDSLPRSGAQRVHYQKGLWISVTACSEGAPDPLLLGQFHISSCWKQEWGVLWLDCLVPVHAVVWNLTRKIISLKKVLPFWQQETVQQLVSRTENLSYR